MSGSDAPVWPVDGPAAYFITFLCHGAWLHGDEKGSVDRFHNIPHTRFLDANPRRLRFEQRLMTRAGVLLAARERRLVLDSIKQHAQYRGWVLHAAHVRSNHVHVVVAADTAPEVVMTQLKAYASRALNRSEGRKRRRWAYHGSTRYLWEPEQVDAAVHYVVHRQGRAMALYINPHAPTQPNPERQ